jgi:arginase
VELAVVCVPYQMDVARWGYARGPGAWLDAGLAAQLRMRGHRVRPPLWIELPAGERTRDGVTNLGRIAARTAAAVAGALAAGADLALVLEGDCTHAVGAIGGLARAGTPPGVVWFDAHGDLNTCATSTSGYWGGMPYAVALGWDLDDWRRAAGLEPPLRPDAAALVGTSDLDAAEVDALARHPILHVDAAALGRPAAADDLGQALQARAAAAPAWYLHVDVDVAGPEEVPGGMTPAPRWPPRAALLAAIAAAAGALPIRVVGLATYNPDGDPSRRGARLGLDALLAAVGAAAAR